MLANENVFRRMIEKAGWLVQHNAWPDFLCSKNGEHIVVEIKHAKDKRTKQQILRLAWFASMGVSAYLVFPHSAWKIAPDGNPTEIDPLNLGIDLSPWRKLKGPLIAGHTEEIIGKLRRGARQVDLAKEYSLSRQRISQIAKKA